MQCKDIAHRRFRRFAALGAFAFAALGAAPAIASVPVSITQQGRLLDDDGPLTGTQAMEFELYDSETDGAVLWSDTQSVSLGEDGVYTVTLGDDSNPIDATLLQDGEVYLQLTAAGETFDNRFPMTSVPFATIADRAQSVVDGGVTAQALAPGAITADAMAPGAVTSEALADDAVTSNAVESLSWDKIAGAPDFLTSDTLEGLSCSSDQIAIYDGSSWVCANQQDTTYTAGHGLDLSGDEFSVADGSFVECLGDQCPVVGENGRFYLDGDTDGGPSFSYGSISLFGSGIISSESMRIQGSLRADNNINTENRIGAGVWPIAPQFPVHVRPNPDDEDELNSAIAMSRPGSSEVDAWALGVNHAAGNLHFRYTENFVNEDTERMAWISRSTGDYNQGSDRTLKREIEDVDDILERVLRLRATRYQFKRQDRDDDRRSYGFIAQEVQELFPDLVSQEEDTLGLSYATFGVLAIQAIQEQQEIIDDLNQQVQSMEERLSKIESQL